MVSPLFSPGVLLAQFGIEAPDFEPLPGPPLYERFLFEQPWPLIAVLLAVAVVGWWILAQRGRARASWVTPLVCLAAAAGVWLLATLVTTEREQLADRSRELVDALAEVDLNRVEGMLDSRVSLYLFDAPDGRNKQAILSAAEEYLGRRYTLVSHQVHDVRAQVRGQGLGRTQVRVEATAEGSRTPNMSWWQLDWVRSSPDEPWRVSAIEPLWIRGLADPTGR